MPVSETGKYKTISVIVTKEQEGQLRAMKDARSNDLRKVSLAEIAREVIAVGLHSFQFDPHSGFATIAPDTDRAA